MSEVNRLRKGDIFLANLNKSYKNMLEGKRLVIIVSNWKVCENSSLITIVPLTSNLDKTALPTHVYIKKEFGTDVDSIAQCEQVQPISKDCLIHKVGEIDQNTMLKIDRAISIQTNGSRTFNISHATQLAESITKFDKLIAEYNIQQDLKYIALRKSLIEELKRFCYQNVIDFDRLINGGKK